jgi:dienelactone hydrolase
MTRRCLTFRLAVIGGLIAASVVAPSSAGAATSGTPVNPIAQLQNLLVSQERQVQFDSPQTIAAVSAAAAQYQLSRLTIDSGRNPNPNACTLVVICQPDPRLSSWTSEGGIVDPVLYTARSGATLSGHVWATVAGPAKRPAIVFINGSIIGYEQTWWYMAQALARAGFVVMTFDAQGEGMSDQFGQAPDQLEGAFAGTPALGLSTDLGGSGLAFYDGGEDTVNFLLSTPSNRYAPAPSRTSGTSHVAKQATRVAAGLDTAFDPLWKMIDPIEVGVTGHSYGAEAASWLAQSDPRIKAGVALDSLCLPVAPSPTELLGILTSPINATGIFGLPTPCFGAPAGPAPAITTPVLGLSSDYLLTPEPYLLTPDPEAKNQASLTYSKNKVDSGQIIVRGGTHYEFADYPSGVIPASKRGIDMATWYTVAWFEKYLKQDPAADALLLTNRWRSDAAAKAVDPSGDGNDLSYLYNSRLDLTTTGGKRFDCENLRSGCGGQTSGSTDGGPVNYSYLAVDTGTEAS